MLVRRAGEPAWRSPTVTTYSNERAIQTIIEQAPHLLLPGSDESRLAVVTELALEAGYVDVVGIGADGAITLAECKLKANPEIRRHVIGQILAYASGLWGLTYEEFDDAFAVRTGSPLARSVAEVAPDGWNEERFRADVAANLRDGRFRLVITVDEITGELEKIVRFLNEHTGPGLQVLALELGYVRDGDLEILLPTVYGTESAQRKADTDRPRWTTDSAFAAFEEQCSVRVLEAVQRLRAFVDARSGRWVSGTGAGASVTAHLPVNGKSVGLFYIWLSQGALTLYIHFGYLIDADVSTESVSRFAEQISRIPAIARTPRIAKKFHVEDLRKAGFKKYPGLLLDDLLAHPDGLHGLASIEKAFDDLVREVDAARAIVGD